MKNKLIALLKQNRYENSTEDGLVIEPFIFDSEFENIAGQIIDFFKSEAINIIADFKRDELKKQLNDILAHQSNAIIQEFENPSKEFQGLFKSISKDINPEFTRDDMLKFGKQCELYLSVHLGADCTDSFAVEPNLDEWINKNKQ